MIPGIFLWWRTFAKAGGYHIFTRCSLVKSSLWTTSICTPLPWSGLTFAHVCSRPSWTAVAMVVHILSIFGPVSLNDIQPPPVILWAFAEDRISVKVTLPLFHHFSRSDRNPYRSGISSSSHVGDLGRTQIQDTFPALYTIRSHIQCKH